MASWKKVIVSGSAISQLNNDANFISSTGGGILSGSAQIAADISGSSTSLSASLASRIAGISTSFTLAADSGDNDTFSSSETLTFSGGNGIDTVVSDNNIAINGVAGLVSGSAQVVALVEAGSDSNTFTDADHSKLNAIEASADVTDTANVTAAGALMDSEVTDLAGIKGVTISTLQVKPSEGAFADGDKTKLDGIEASADVTDTANVTAAGAVMDSELTSEASVKAINQGLATSNSPTFVGLTLTGNLEVQGSTTTVDSTTIELGDNILAVNGTGAALGGLHVNDSNGPASGSILWDGATNQWIAGASGSETKLFVKGGDDSLLSGSAQIASDISGSVTSLSASLASRIANQSQTITLAADSGTNDTYTTGETLTFAGANGLSTVVSDNQIQVTAGGALLSGSAQIAADISGSSTSLSASLASRIAGISTDFDDITNKPALISASAEGSAQGQITLNGAAVNVNALGTNDSPSFTNLTVNGDLTVTGNTFEAQVTNLNVEDKFILVNSGSTSGDSGIVFGGSDGSTANQGNAIFWDNDTDVFGFAADLASNATSATVTSKLGNIETHATADPSSGPTLQGKGTIFINEDSEAIFIYS